MLNTKKAKSLSINNIRSSSIPYIANTSFIFFGCWNKINCSRKEKSKFKYPNSC